jgi:hypothetical protein
VAQDSRHQKVDNNVAGESCWNTWTIISL